VSRFIRSVSAASLAILFLFFVACARKQARAPAIGEAYAGPATLHLRKDIPLQSPVAGTARHGDRLEIIQHRRRFMKVRTAKGVEGWTEDRLLLSPREMASLKAFERDVKSLPSQGVATTYEVLNVHTEPDRLSPSFIQLRENEKFDVVAHRVAPRVSAARKPLVPLPVKKSKEAKKKRETGKHAPPPMPPPPPVPPNWRELSQDPPEIVAARAAEKEAPSLPGEDWSLIRTGGGESGWVLTRRLFMAIPDEVAQYAEGRRITSYFALGDVQDGGQVKHNWLWTTVGSAAGALDFDSFRVFIWSLRRHRYETAYIERNLRGYFPVQLQQVQYGNPVKVKGGPTTNIYPGFSVCTQNKEGARVRKSYAFLVNIVRYAGSTPCEMPPIESPKVTLDTFVASAQQTQAEGETQSFMDRLRARWSTLRKRWFGRSQ
jgi:hypothetical protein